jgi:uncharacterized protein YodC (DUF2158 family)
MIMELDKIYFMPGDIVELKQNIPNKPTMIVVKKKTLTIKPKDEDKTNFLQGMLCMWFTTDGLYQERVFNTKDLRKV